MNLFEKIDLFYKMAQKLEENTLKSEPSELDETVEKTQDLSIAAAIKNRRAKFAKLIKGS
jgi:hypothetical protein